MKSKVLVFFHSVLCLSLLLLSSCANPQIATSEIKTPSPTLTPTITPFPSPTPTASITPAVILKSNIHPLALNENNIRNIKNLVTFGTPSNSCLHSSKLDSAIDTRSLNGQAEYLLASKDHDESQNIEIWNLITKEIVQTFSDSNADAVLFTPDHNTLISFSVHDEPSALTLYDIQSGNQRQKFIVKRYSDERISISLDGLRIALFSVQWYPENFRVSEFDLQTNEIIDSNYEFPLFRESPAPHIYSPSGNLIAVTYGTDDKLHLLDVTNNKDTILQFPFSDLLDAVLAEAIMETIAISSNEKYLVGGTLGGNIYIWDFASGSLLKSLAAHESDISDGWIGGIKILEFSLMSNLLLSVGYDGFTKLWDANSGDLLKTINTCHHFGGFTQDGRYLVTVGKNGIEVWGIP